MSTNTNTQHTPGPWAIDGKTVKYVDHGKYYTVARADNPKFTPEANRANAVLIAAAPELLDALEELLAYHLFIGNSAESSRVEMARAAIAKAKGGAA